MSRSLGRQDIQELLEALAAELDRRGITADVFLVGGAAMTVAYDARRATRDLDAVFAPTDAVRAAVAAIAQRSGLRPDWLNDAVKGFLPGPDPDARRFFSSPALRVDVASPEFLLAMNSSPRESRQMPTTSGSSTGSWASRRWSRGSTSSEAHTGVGRSTPGCSIWSPRSWTR